MSDSFDPYREWLSITDPERPPNYYRLLGLEMFDQDIDKVWPAAVLRMAQVLEHDPGPNGQDARRIFDELEAARVCLSSAEQKRSYDAALKHRIDEMSFTVGTSQHDSALDGLELPPVHENLVAVGTSEGAAHRTSTVQRPASHDGGSVTRRLREGSTSRHVHEPSTSSSHPALRPRKPSTDRRVLLVGVGIVAGVALIVLGFSWFTSEPAEVDPVAPLVKKLRSPDWRERTAAAEGLMRLGPRAGPAVPNLVATLREDPRAEVRMAAAQALTHCGVSSDIVGPDLELLIPFEPDPTVRQMMKGLVQNSP